MTVDTIIELTDLLENIHRIADLPADEATSMPAEAFTSVGLLEKERKNIFSKEWICVGREDEITSTGDYFTAEVNLVPIIVVRNEQEKLQVLVNVCQHRMAKLVEGQGKARVFVCPYHAWSYDLEGKLVSAPKMVNRKFDKKNCNLPSVRLEVWQGFIYVNLDKDAKPLAPRLQDLTARIRHYRVESMTSVWRKTLIWKTNWKVLIENFLEVYHIPTVHRDTLEPYGDLELFKSVEPADGYSFYLQGQEKNSADFDKIINPENHIENPELTGFELFNTFVGCVFPSQLMSISWFGVLWLTLHPLTAGEIRIEWGVLGPVKGLPLNADKYEEYFFPEFINQVNMEDKPRVEAVQRGAESGYAVAGPLHENYEETIRQFIRYLSRKFKES
jgi:choline monooxygenase